jgi:hypothetical protein
MDLKIFNQFIGKKITDIYNKNIGTMIGFSTNAKKEVTTIGIMLGNSGFVQYPNDNFTIEDGTIRYNNPWKMEAESINIEYNALKRKIFALETLHNKGEVPEEVYNEMIKQFDTSKNDITERRHILLTSVKGKIEELNLQIKKITAFLTNIKIENIAGFMDDNAYGMANNSIQKLIKQFLNRREDLQFTAENISKLSISSPLKDKPQSTEDEFPHPIVLQIKDESPN